MLPPEADRIRKICNFRQVLIGESDRGSALMAAAFLDDSLSILLKKNLIDDKKANQEIFDHNGPLGTFSGKINLGYSMGLIANNVKRELNILRKIRNDFAHTAEQIGFEQDTIRNRCLSLHLHGRKVDATARQKFLSSMIMICIAIEEQVLRSAQIVVKEDAKFERRQDSIEKFRHALATIGRTDCEDILREFI